VKRAVLVGTGAWLAAFALALVLDSRVTEWLAAPQVSERLLAVLLPLLAGAVYVCLFAALSRFANRRRLYIGFFVATLASALLTHILKIVIGRARPVAGLGPFVFEPFTIGERLDGFPSGHTSFAVTAALLLGTYFPHGRPYFYFLAACVALERIVVGWHYPTDTIAGAGVAIMVVTLCRRTLGPWFFDPQLRPSDSTGPAESFGRQPGSISRRPSAISR